MSDKRLLDVLMHKSTHRIKPTDKPIRSRFDLSDDLRIDILDRDIAHGIFNACEPGYNSKLSRRGYGQLYSFIRENPPIAKDSKLRWDTDRRLEICVALSRLIHPTSIAMEYAARLFLNEDGSAFEIVPGSEPGPNSKAFIIDTENNFLTIEDVRNLKQLLEAFKENPLKEPLTRALLYHEYASRSNEFVIRWILIAMGLEAIIHTDRNLSTKQFYRRVSQLSTEVGAGTLNEKEAKETYELRSSVAHGQGLENIKRIKKHTRKIQVKRNKKELYEKMETVLRLTIKKSILDRTLMDLLSDPKKIEEKWPVENNRRTARS